MKDKTIKCLNPNCNREACIRGLCRTCYTRASRLVREKRVTWEELVKQGKVLPSNRLSYKITEWLLEE